MLFLPPNAKMTNAQVRGNFVRIFCNFTFYLVILCVCRMSVEKRNEYFQCLLDHVLNLDVNENGDRFEDTVNNNDNISDNELDNGNSIDGYNSGGEINDVEVEIDENNDSDYEEGDSTFDDENEDPCETTDGKNYLLFFLLIRISMVCFIFLRCIFHLHKKMEKMEKAATANNATPSVARYFPLRNCRCHDCFFYFT